MKPQPLAPMPISPFGTRSSVVGPVSSQKEARSRLVVTETVYHQQPNEQPTSVETRFAKWLATDEQPWDRRDTIDSKEWKPLETGWIEQASVMVLQCKDGAIDYGICAVGVGVVTVSLVPSGSSIRLFPYSLHEARIRGKGSYRLVLMPE